MCRLQPVVSRGAPARLSRIGRGRAMSRLQGKIAIVFGAGSVGPEWGNGKATAVLFARNSAHIVCVDVNRDAAEETVGIIQGEGAAAAFACDVTDSSGVRDVV